MIPAPFRQSSRATVLRCLALVLLAVTTGLADDTPDAAVKYGTRFRLPGVNGTLLIAGDRGMETAVPLFLQAARGNGTSITIVAAEAHRAAADRLLRACRALGLDGVHAELDQPLKLDQTKTLWLFDASPTLAPAVQQILRRGGTVGMSESVAAALHPLPGYLIESRTPPGQSSQTSDDHPASYVRLLIPPSGVLHVGGRRGKIHAGYVTTVLAASASRPIRTRRWTKSAVFDLVTLSRAAVARAGAPFPVTEPGVPEVPSGGTLYIAGGGQSSHEAIARFIEASGGADAKIVVIPTALGSGGPEMGQSDVRRLRRNGARNVVIAHARTPEEAESPAVLARLRGAGGLWFSGGRQWRCVDAYLDTTAEKLMHDVLARGGAVGGSSAGASIQAEYLVRGHPLGNTVMMAEGYERGLGFLRGVAIDQHFTQRGRLGDMVAFKKVFPQLLGIGLDESTGIFVTGHIMEVVGAHEVSVYDHAHAEEAEWRTRLRAGDRYDLRLRRKLN